MNICSSKLGGREAGPPFRPGLLLYFGYPVAIIPPTSPPAHYDISNNGHRKSSPSLFTSDQPSSSGQKSTSPNCPPLSGGEPSALWPNPNPKCCSPHGTEPPTAAVLLSRPGHETSPNAQVLLQPTGSADLEAYRAITTGEAPPRAPESMFVQNLYCTTPNNVLPVAERVSLSVSSNLPYCTLVATPATKSTDEVNKLTLTRRHPTRGSWRDACTGEIQPRLVLQD
ncbi:hypothetical protein B9Z19DRAFT_1095323 [Tuber borchii]|uniref:Uncharacterized protein n=1 Tax=Tuber borchii TaxID=42251 RepID=A0A2T6ZCT9_TUBBO|nr:hypothetical protein B9Z19DRAFT_1095323 [Tuber borchii]